MAIDTQKLATQVSRKLAEGDRRGFVRAVAQLIDARAPMTSGWKSLSQPLFDFGELDLARRVMDRYADALGTAQAQVERALIYVRCSRPVEARAILDVISTSIPDPASNAYLRGTIALNLGERDLAREQLLRAQAARPGSGQIFQTLSMLGSMADEPEVAERILAGETAMRDAPRPERASYLYALGKTLDDRRETDAAFRAFAEGAAIVAAERPYDGIADLVAAEQATEGWSAAAIADIGRNITIPTDRPIVVTGLPRSGSTLVEQILTSHSAVSDGDEVGRFTIVVNEIGGPRYADYREWARTHTPTEASRTYLHLLAQRFGPNGRVVDKTLEASRYLGLLAAVMPDAPIYWMRRNAIDNAWSCFSTWFLVGLPWSWSQPAMARHFLLEDNLLRRWQDILGPRLHVVDYEALVSDKDAEIPRLLAHAGLAMEDATLSPEKNTRLVTTASVSQVRAPINTKAVGRAQRYAPHLQPFIDAYGYTG